MAAPHVAGAFALLKSAAPSASIDHLMATLTSSGETVVDSRNGIATPRIQLDAALAALTGEVVEPPSRASPDLSPPLSLSLSPSPIRQTRGETIVLTWPSSIPANTVTSGAPTCTQG